MDVLSQALDVVEEAESGSGSVTLTLDLDQPAQRAAYAAALAVLRVSGVELPDLHASGLDTPALREPAPRQAGRDGSDTGRSAGPGSAGTDPTASGTSGAGAGSNDDPNDPIRRSYREALSELTPDEARLTSVVNDTYPRVQELLRDGVNVDSVAQIQYRRWVEEHLDSVRN